MIQRIQSVFLLIIAIVMFLMAAVLPIWKGTDGTRFVTLMSTGMLMKEGETVTSLSNPIAILILALIAGIVALFSIFQFKNRLLQMKLGALNSLIMALTLGASIYYISVGQDQLTAGEANQSFYLTGAWMPIVGLLMNFLANRFIRKDERLVRDADRLR